MPDNAVQPQTKSTVSAQSGRSQNKAVVRKMMDLGRPLLG